MKKKQPLALSLCLLIFCSFVAFEVGASSSAQAVISSFGSVSLSSTPTVATFGNTEIGALANYFGTAKDASRFQLTQNGVLQSITVYFANTGYNAKTAIYTDNNGAPSALITQSNSQTVTSTGWNTFTTPQITLMAGTYWLCTVSSSNSAMGKMSQSTTINAWKPTAYANEYTSTFGAPTGYDTTPTSIFATINPTTITPTPAATPTPSPTPTSPSSSSTNLEPLNAFYADANAWGYAFLDTTILTPNGNPCIRGGPDNTGRMTREVDGAWLSVKPGDHIYFAAWVKTDAYSSADGNPGGRIGIDFYVHSNLGYGIACIDSNTGAGVPNAAEDASGYADPNHGGHLVRLPWGNNWTLLVYDLYIPSQPISHVFFGGPIQSCNPCYIDSLCPWFDAHHYNDPANVYWGDPVFYINPTGL